MWPADVGVVVWSLCCAVLWERSQHSVTSDKRKLSVCAAKKGIKRGRSENDVGLQKTLCCEVQPHLPQEKDKAGRIPPPLALEHRCFLHAGGPKKAPVCKWFAPVHACVDSNGRARNYAGSC